MGRTLLVGNLVLDFIGDDTSSDDIKYAFVLGACHVLDQDGSVPGVGLGGQLELNCRIWLTKLVQNHRVRVAHSRAVWDRE